MATPTRPRLYRELLTPLLHRRFTRAAGVALIVCYAEAVLLGEKSSLWWWFPVGTTGIRALLLFLTPLAVFVLRVAQLHFEAFNTKSPFETLTKRLVRLDVLHTFAWYLFSAWWFGEVYIWSASDGANLGWIAEGKYWEKKRLNERPIYLRSVVVMLAFVQTFIHLYYDSDRVYRPTSPEMRAADRRPRAVGSPWVQLQASALFLFRQAVFRSVIISVVGPFVYTLFLRRTAWNWMLSLARLFWDMPAVVEMSFMPPYHISLLTRSWGASFFLILLWESSNVIFGAFLAQEPLKKGVPLTDTSPDPNRTLLNGLRAHKGVVKTFAFWELLYISQRFEARRKSIFADIDRSTGPVWNQILSAGLQTLEEMNTRIAESQKTPSPNSPPRPPADLQSLPRLASPLRQDHVLQTPPLPSNRLEKFESQLGTIAKSYGQSPPSLRPRSPVVVSPRAKQYLSAARQKLLTQGQRESLTPSHVRAVFHDYLLRFLRSSAGVPFRQTFQLRVRAIMFGSPESSCGHIIDSVDALSRLAVASLTEDNFGKVSPDVPRLIRTYVSTMTTVENFVQGMGPHWTDVEGVGDKRVVEVEAVLLALRAGLRTLVDGFGSFKEPLKITDQEIATARTLAGMDDGPEEPRQAIADTLLENGDSGVR